MGEVALVSHSSPISQTGMLFYNQLIDENASSHLALGKAYKLHIISRELCSVARPFFTQGTSDA